MEGAPFVGKKPVSGASELRAPCHRATVPHRLLTGISLAISLSRSQRMSVARQWTILQGGIKPMEGWGVKTVGSNNNNNTNKEA